MCEWLVATGRCTTLSPLAHELRADVLHDPPAEGCSRAGDAQLGLDPDTRAACVLGFGAHDRAARLLVGLVDPHRASVPAGDVADLTVIVPACASPSESSSAAPGRQGATHSRSSTISDARSMDPGPAKFVLDSHWLRY
jgi:hypothetical protein